MARYRAMIEAQQSPAELFAYLSDFSTAEEWDPGIVDAERLGNEPIGEGTQFRLVADFLGRKTSLTYRIVEYAPPHEVTFLGENASVTSRDRIMLEPFGSLTRVIYDADLKLKGALRVLDPLLRVAFKRTGDRALEGLRASLSRRESEGLGAAA